MAKKNFDYSEIEIRNNFTTGISTHVDWEPNTNIIDAGALIIIEVELPGVIKDDISIYLQDKNILIIRGLKRQPRINEPERLTYYLFEREFGTFYKRITISFPLDTSKIESTMENGVLTLQIPKKKTESITVDIKSTD